MTTYLLCRQISQISLKIQESFLWKTQKMFLILSFATFGKSRHLTNFKDKKK